MIPRLTFGCPKLPFPGQISNQFQEDFSVKILVPIKRVPDAETTIKVNPEGNGIVEAGVKWVVNPFCEIAIESPSGYHAAR